MNQLLKLKNLFVQTPLWLCVVLCFGFAATHASEVTFQRVVYQGFNETQVQFIENQFPGLSQNSLKLSDIDQIIIVASQRFDFSQVAITEENQLLTVLAIPFQRIRQIKIEGAENVSETDIYNVLPFKSSDPIDIATIELATENLREVLGRNGFFDPIIDIRLSDPIDNTVSLTVFIQERNLTTIDRIEFIGDNEDLKTKLKNAVRKIRKQPFSDLSIANIEQTANQLLLEKRFILSSIKQSLVRYTDGRNKAILYYEVEFPYSFEFLLYGNTNFTSSRLINELKVELIPKGNSNPSDWVSKQLKNFYVAEGFPNVSISTREKTLASTWTKQISLFVTENPKVRISSLDVGGRISRPADYYKKIILNNSSEKIANGVYVKGDLELGQKNLITQLNNEGFLLAKILSTRFDPTEDRKAAEVSIVVDEGPLTRLTTVEFKNATRFGQPVLQTIFGLKPNDPLRLDEVTSGLERIKSHYQNQGFLEMRIENPSENLVIYEEDGAKASIQMIIHEGPKITIKRIVIQGNAFTKDYVIFRELDLSVGELLTPDVLSEAKKRLEKMAIFSNVDLQMAEANSDIAERTLLVKVSETNPGVFRFGPGLTNKNKATLRGFGGIYYNNLFGTARAISLRGTIENNLVFNNYLEYDVTASYLEPFLFNRRLRGRATFTRSEKVTDFDEKLDNSTVHATDQMLLTVERDLTSKIKLSWLVLGLDSVEQFQVPKQLDDNKTHQQIGYIGPTIDIDYRDNPFLPTRGFFTKLDTEYSHPELGSSSGIEFFRSQATFSFYQQLWNPKFVWANSIRGGYARNISDESGSGIPVSFAFFLGGYSTLRGFSGSKQDRIPFQSEFPVSDNQLVVPKETNYYLVKTELRFPIYDILGGVLFYDGGQVKVQKFDFDHPYQQAAGAGIRINTLVGPITLDYARKIAPFDKRYVDQWHFTIGTF
jgi:outer membrane protein insertion porin family